MGVQAKYTIKDSVFTNLFRDKKYIVQLYEALFPNAEDIEEEDITILTLENVLINSMYNDLGFMAGNRLIVLVEAQSTWSMNILVRMFMYVANTYKEYVTEKKIDLYGPKKAALPKPELFVIYTGKRAIAYEKISLADEFFGGDKTIDMNIKVLTDGRKNDIIYQYVAFTKVPDSQIDKHGRNERAVSEAIRIY